MLTGRAWCGGVCVPGGEALVRVSDEGRDLCVVGAYEDDGGLHVEFGIAGVSPAGCEEAVVASELLALLRGTSRAVVLHHHGSPAASAIHPDQSRVWLQTPCGGSVRADPSVAEVCCRGIVGGSDFSLGVDHAGARSEDLEGNLTDQSATVLLVAVFACGERCDGAVSRPPPGTTRSAASGAAQMAQLPRAARPRP
jgi:hypothetical protein